uniref:Uncharacterized protein n=1 Tax=viral metagenome TaxID=1070528 RepID=A0A6C0BDR2_9ZZZZ
MSDYSGFFDIINTDSLSSDSIYSKKKSNVLMKGGSSQPTVTSLLMKAINNKQYDYANYLMAEDFVPENTVQSGGNNVLHTVLENANKLKNTNLFVNNIIKNNRTKDFDTKNSKGHTPTSIATSKGLNMFVNMLIGGGAKRKTDDFDIVTDMDTAKPNIFGKDDINTVDVLKKFNSDVSTLKNVESSIPHYKSNDGMNTDKFVNNLVNDMKNNIHGGKKKFLPDSPVRNANVLNEISRAVQNKKDEYHVKALDKVKTLLPKEYKNDKHMATVVKAILYMKIKERKELTGLDKASELLKSVTQENVDKALLQKDLIKQIVKHLEEKDKKDINSDDLKTINKPDNKNDSSKVVNKKLSRSKTNDKSDNTDNSSSSSDSLSDDSSSSDNLSSSSSDNDSSSSSEF